jgi:hypothetical protein
MTGISAAALRPRVEALVRPRPVPRRVNGPKLMARPAAGAAAAAAAKEMAAAPPTVRGIGARFGSPKPRGIKAASGAAAAPLSPPETPTAAEPRA